MMKTPVAVAVLLESLVLALAGGALGRGGGLHRLQRLHDPFLGGGGEMRRRMRRDA
ncbi:MAG: hypothetical protein V3U28_04550 [Candidatus Acidoferrales bacterium]